MNIFESDSKTDSGKWDELFDQDKSNGILRKEEELMC